MISNYMPYEKLLKLLEPERFSALSDTEITQVLRSCLVLPAAHQEEISPLISQQIADSKAPRSFVSATLAYPRFDWIRAAISAHGVQIYADLAEDTTLRHDAAVLLDAGRLQAQELCKTLEILHPAFSNPGALLRQLTNEYAGSNLDTRYAATIKAANISQLVICEEIEALEPWQPHMPKLRKLCADAFDACYTPSSGDFRIVLQSANLNGHAYVLAAAAAKGERFPDIPIQDYTTRQTNGWLANLAQIKTSNHKRLALMKALGKVGGTRKIFSLPQKRLISLIETHCPT